MKVSWFWEVIISKTNGGHFKLNIVQWRKPFKSFKWLSFFLRIYKMSFRLFFLTWIFYWTFKSVLKLWVPELKIFPVKVNLCIINAYRIKVKNKARNSRNAAPIVMVYHMLQWFFATWIKLKVGWHLQPLEHWPPCTRPGWPDFRDFSITYRVRFRNCHPWTMPNV